MAVYEWLFMNGCLLMTVHKHSACPTTAIPYLNEPLQASGRLVDLIDLIDLVYTCGHR